MALKILIELLLHVLQGTIKNPKSVANELHSLVQVRDELNGLIVAIDPQQEALRAPVLSESDKITVESLNEEIANLRKERTLLVHKQNEMEKKITDLSASFKQEPEQKF